MRSLEALLAPLWVRKRAGEEGVGFSGLARGRTESEVTKTCMYSWTPAPQPMYHNHHTCPLQREPAASRSGGVGH